MKIKLSRYYPKYCVWELTLVCNMKCLHCGSSAGGPGRKNELTTKEALNVADQLAELGTERLTLSGGELFLRKDWDKIAARLKAHKIRVGLITNGYLLKENLKKIVSILPLDVIAVSLDGTRKIHDNIRQIPGSFEKVVEGFKLLKKERAYTGCITSVSKMNIKDLEEIYKILVDLGVDAWQIQMVFPGGRMRERVQDCPAPSDMHRVAKFIAQKRQEKKILVYPADCIGYYTHIENQIRKTQWTGCYAGLLVVGIEANGNVKGCLSLAPELRKNNPFVEGNVRKKSLKEIWEKPDGFSYNRKFDLRKVKGLCGKCWYLKQCRCGCKSTCYFFFGTTYKNTYCIYQQEVLAKGKQQVSFVPEYPTFTRKSIFGPTLRD